MSPATKSGILSGLAVAAIMGPTTFIAGRLTASIGDKLAEGDAGRVAQAFLDDPTKSELLVQAIQTRHAEVLKKLEEELKQDDPFFQIDTLQKQLEQFTQALRIRMAKMESYPRIIEKGVYEGTFKKGSGSAPAYIADDKSKKQTYPKLGGPPEWKPHYRVIAMVRHNKEDIDKSLYLAPFVTYKKNGFDVRVFNTHGGLGGNNEEITIDYIVLDLEPNL